MKNLTNKVFSIVTLIVCIFVTSLSFGLPADDVIPLVDEDYYPQAHQSLIAANKSIFCVMYVADIDPRYNRGWEYNLVNDLINAHRRGVAVTVIFDQNMVFRETHEKTEKTRKRSQRAYEMLKKNGVSVYYDSNKRVTHSKILVIDEYITIVGSTNWTYSALRKNHEASVLIRSHSVAEAFLEKLRAITKY